MKNFNIANVLDHEATCWEDGITPEGQVREVVEFGLTTVDLKSRTILKTVSIPVIPVMSTVSPYCTELTGWTDAKLRRQGVPFAEACRRIAENYGGRGRLLITDSDSELDLVTAQCGLLKVDLPFGPHRLNVSNMLALLGKLDRNLSLEAKLALFGLEFEGRAHSAGADSRNIARLLQAILERCSLTF